MRKCFECSAEMGEDDRFCGMCGADSGPEPSSTAPPSNHQHPLFDEVPEKPMQAEVFSVDEAEEVPLRLGDEDIDIEDSEEFVASDGPDIPQDVPEEEEVEIGAPNVAIVSLDGEGDEVEDAPIEAMPEEFLPDVPNQAHMGAYHDADEVISVEPEMDSEPIEIEEGSDAIIELTPDLLPDIDYASLASDAMPEISRADATRLEPSAASTGGGARASKLKPLGEGTLLSGRYEIVKKIGGGGMGAVYLANDRNLGGASRAVKEMVQSYIEAEQQEKAINDFKREGLLLTSLEHQAIPTIYDYFFDETECRFYLVMKYIPGGDLATRIRTAPEGRLDELTVTQWAIEIADVLDYLHRHDPPIVYRDLKPANVMIDSNTGRVMLIDFGIARWINKEERGVTAVGTMGYAPPELFSGSVEPRSDIYSLGSTMFHLLTGADPQSNPLLIFDFDKNPRPRQINPRLSEQIEAILVRAVQYDAHARFRSAAEMRDALSSHLEDLKAGKGTFGGAPQKESGEPAAVFCGFCGKSILATDMFCSYCGRPQTIVRGVNAPSFKPGFGSVRLQIAGSGGLGVHAFVLEKDVNVIGRRDPANDIFPEIDLSKYDAAAKVSRRHARVSRTPAGYMLEDLGSANGTLLQRAGETVVQLAKGRMYDLQTGDRIKLGETTLEFILE